MANFQPANDMSGFFMFQVRVKDKGKVYIIIDSSNLELCGHSHSFSGGNEAFADTQIVIIATENQIFLTFNNPIEYVTTYDKEVISYIQHYSLYFSILTP